MLKVMMLMFFLFSLLMIPAIVLYGTNNGLRDLSNFSKARFSLGNFGFSGDICRSMYLGVNREQIFSCKEGRISELANYGLIPTDYRGKDYCGSRDANPSV